MTTILLPRSLVEMFPAAQRRVELRAPDVAAVIDALDARWPGMSDRLCEPGPRIRPFINVFVDGQPADLATPVQETSTVHVIPAVAGGA